MIIMLLIALFLPACDDIGKPKKLSLDTADVAGDVLEIVGTVTGNSSIKETGKEIEKIVEEIDAENTKS